MDAAAELLSDPAVQEGLAQTASSAATGSWAGTVWGIGATVAAVFAYGKVKKARAKTSPQA